MGVKRLKRHRGRKRYLAWWRWCFAEKWNIGHAVKKLVGEQISVADEGAGRARVEVA